MRRLSMKFIGADGSAIRATIFSYSFCAAAVMGLSMGVALMLGVQAPPPAPAPEARQAFDFGGPDRYLTHVSTNKPVYRTGETLYVRGIILRGNEHVPMAGSGNAFVEIKGPKGDTVTTGSAAIVDSTIGFYWNIPTTQTGGEYTVRVSHPLTGDAPAERKFDVRAYRAPRLKSQIVFVRDGYGPGDAVNASVHVDRAEGG